MCGIAGFLGPWPASLATAMTGALDHRGPDGSGQWTDADAGLALGHTRLAIIDLTDGGAQPMTSADDRYVITYNGEIYNYRDLREGLRQAGVTFRTDSDTEVLLELFAREGRDCLTRLRGIFAFAIWDRTDRRLTLARDQLGVKPLYVAPLDTGTLFASEIKALTLCPDLPRDIDRRALADHVGFVWTAGEATILKHVRKLRPGCWMTVDKTGLQEGRYYETPMQSEAGDSSAPDADGLATLIDDIVARQMVADVEVGALLSGGVDSSAIVASMGRVTPPDSITAFCATAGGGGGPADNFGDDGPHARMVADALGVGLIEVPTEADLLAALPEMIWSLDEPTADFAAWQTALIAKAARDHGIKVLMSGTGGDDVFTGYGRHTAALIWKSLDRFPGGRSMSAFAASRARPTSVRGRRLQRLGALLALDEDDMLVEAMTFSGIAPDRRTRLFTDTDAASAAPAALRERLTRTRGRNPVARLLDLELNGFLPDHNLNYTDKMAMRSGVEVRVPLVDVDLVDAAMNIALAEKIDRNQTKKFLRASQKGRIPDAVLTRPKQGFGVPMRGWLAGAAREMLEELTAARTVTDRGLFDPDETASLREDFFAGKVDAAFTLFPMMAAEIWCRGLDAHPPLPLTTD